MPCARRAWPSGARPQRRTGVTSVPLDDNVALYDDVGRVLILLNAGAAAVWEGCDGVSTRADLVDRLAEAHREPRAAIDRDVGATLDKLVELGLVSDAGEPVPGLR